MNNLINCNTLVNKVLILNSETIVSDGKPYSNNFKLSNRFGK